MHSLHKLFIQINDDDEFLFKNEPHYLPKRPVTYLQLLSEKDQLFKLMYSSLITINGIVA